MADGGRACGAAQAVSRRTAREASGGQPSEAAGDVQTRVRRAVQSSGGDGGRDDRDASDGEGSVGGSIERSGRAGESCAGGCPVVDEPETVRTLDATGSGQALATSTQHAHATTKSASWTLRESDFTVLRDTLPSALCAPLPQPVWLSRPVALLRSPYLRCPSAVAQAPVARIPHDPGPSRQRIRSPAWSAPCCAKLTPTFFVHPRDARYRPTCEARSVAPSALRYAPSNQLPGPIQPGTASEALRALETSGLSA
ncbi:hypothetical protein PSPO01_10883 [Paraphaeosphaeria sporulosa]